MGASILSSPLVTLFNGGLSAVQVGYQYVTPSTGDTVSITNGINTLLVDPSGTLVTLTINLPDTPTDGQVVRIAASKAITTLTLGSGAASLVAGISTLAIGGFASYVYRLTNTTWYRCG